MIRCYKNLQLSGAEKPVICGQKNVGAVDLSTSFS